MSRSKVFLLVLISFIAGIGVESFVVVPTMVILGTFLAVMVALACAWNRKKKNLAVVSIIMLACLAGTVRMRYGEDYAPDVSAFSGHRITLEGVAVEDPRLSEKNQIALVNVRKIGLHRTTAPLFISMLLRKYPVYQQGDVMTSQGMFEAKPYNGVTSGTLFSVQEKKEGEEHMNILLRWMRAGRRAFEGHIDAALPEPHASFMKGLLLGERASMPAGLVQQFKQAGVSHIVALSGYNITLVGTFLVNILLIITVPFFLALWIASASIVLFVLFAGAQASLIRAAIMGILVLIAAREGRIYDMVNALVFAGAAMLCANPYLLRFDAGFQLSFLATLGLIYLAIPVHSILTRIEYRVGLFIGGKHLQGQKEHRTANAIKKIMSETIAAQLAVLPLLVYLFGGISVVAPISNLFVLSAVPPAMAFGFLTGVSGFIWQPISVALGWCAWSLLEYQLIMIDFFSRMPFSFVSVSSAGGILIAVIYIVAGLAWWRKNRRLRDGP